MRYHDITLDDMKNGDGLRVVLWVSGCEHHCEKCQNPITWNPDDGEHFDEKVKKELYSYLSRDYISGITFSGGDPLFPNNIETVTSLASEIKALFPEKTIWLYTGYTWDDVKNNEIIDYIDVIVDGLYIDDLRDVKLKWRGSANQRVIDVQKTKYSDTLVLYCD